jgi:carbonic anhydrase
MKTNLYLSLTLGLSLFFASCNSEQQAPAATKAATSTATAAASTTDQAAAVITAEQQAKITPDEALNRLKEGNKRFASGNELKRNHVGQVKNSAAGQSPHAIVLGCMDSRTSPELIFDQGIGDVFDIRIAGNFATEDIIGSMEYAVVHSHAKLILVTGHTSCGGVKGACDDAKMGNLTKTLANITPATKRVKGFEGARDSKNKDYVAAVAKANVEMNMEHIKTKSPLLAEAIKKGELKVVGSMYDLETGVVTFYDEAAPTTGGAAPTSAAPAPSAAPAKGATPAAAPAKAPTTPAKSAH